MSWNSAPYNVDDRLRQYFQLCNTVAMKPKSSEEAGFDAIGLAGEMGAIAGEADAIRTSIKASPEQAEHFETILTEGERLASLPHLSAESKEASAKVHGAFKALGMDPFSRDFE